jgi:hypothetical protein
MNTQDLRTRAAELESGLSEFHTARKQAMSAHKRTLLAGCDVGDTLREVQRSIGRARADVWCEAHGLSRFEAHNLLRIAEWREQIQSGQLDMKRVKRLFCWAGLLPSLVVRGKGGVSKEIISRSGKLVTRRPRPARTTPEKT